MDPVGAMGVAQEINFQPTGGGKAAILAVANRLAPVVTHAGPARLVRDSLSPVLIVDASFIGKMGSQPGE